MKRKLLFWIVTRVILRCFHEGVQPIYGSNDSKNKVIAYQWTFKNESL